MNYGVLTWWFFCSKFWRFDKFEPKQSEYVKSSERRTKNNWQIIKTKHLIGFSKRKSEGDFWFESVKSSKRMHIRPRGSRLLPMYSVKFHSTPRSTSNRLSSKVQQKKIVEILNFFFEKMKLGKKKSFHGWSYGIRGFTSMSWSMSSFEFLDQ